MLPISCVAFWINAVWDRSLKWSQFRSSRWQRGCRLGRVRRALRVRRRSSARSIVRGVRSAARCGVTRRGADGPARRPNSVSRRGGRDHRHFTRRELPRATTGWPGCKDEVPREELLAGTGPVPGATRAHLRTNRPLEKKPGTMAGLAQGWAGHPCHSRQMQLTKAANARSGRSHAALGHALGGSGSGSDSLSLMR